MPSPSRRSFLRAAGVTLALPFLETTHPAKGADGKPVPIPRRMLAVQTNMGILPQFFFPEKAGKDYAALAVPEEAGRRAGAHDGLLRRQPSGRGPGRTRPRSASSPAPRTPERGGFRNGVSLDQFAAESIGKLTRYPSLVLANSNEGATLSYTRSGCPHPVAEKPEEAVPQAVPCRASRRRWRRASRRWKQGRSVLDFVAEQSKRLNKTLSNADRQRMDQYFTSVRDLESQLKTAAEGGSTPPKPVVTAKPPEDIDEGIKFVARTRLMFDVIKLALETDSSRLVSLFIDTTVIHNITHHGNRPELLAELRKHEEAQFDVLASSSRS